MMATDYVNVWIEDEVENHSHHRGLSRQSLRRAVDEDGLGSTIMS